MSILEDAKAIAQGAMQGVMAKAVGISPDRWVPGGGPDPRIPQAPGHVRRRSSRVGRARGG